MSDTEPAPVVVDLPGDTPLAGLLRHVGAEAVPVGAVPVEVPQRVLDVARSIDILPGMLERVPEAVRLVNLWRKDMINRGRMDDEDQLNEAMGVATVVATWAQNGVIAARVRAQITDEAAPNQAKPSDVIIVGARMTEDVLAMVREVEAAFAARVRAEERQRVAAEIRTYAGPLTDQDVCSGVSAWPRERAAGYTAAIDGILEEVLDVAGSAAPR